ncbi:DNA topoisomerase IB [Georhizobium profundi]|uniref:DNA topoisomerase n=1 Tax=Georhizobium profundi TaxID=2341112 RepID=A0A3Q8XMX5_9HYPH|nr:DNA topoisomerase IB [Georhizobium profundi]AZN71299.1 DNA topoisomerase IB [Georhizobium profundi]
MIERISAEEHAKAARLIYVSDETPGFRRRKAGRGFYYVTPEGDKLGAGDHIDRIRSLAIPPAYQDVWITVEPLGHLQATGRDQRGRKQYRYHPKWHESRDATKYGELASFAQLLPTIREQVDADLRRRSLSYEKVTASVVWMLDNLLIRVGNEIYAKQNKSFGLTTLKKRHLDISGSVMRFRFKGKSGKEWNLTHTDRRIAKIIRTIHELPGHQLFQYETGDGGRSTVKSDDINAYLREITGSELSSKLFRTWSGTRLAAIALSELEAPTSKTDAFRKINAAVDAVSSRLGNTRAVCRRCYIHPAVIDTFEEGSLRDELKAIRPSRGAASEWMDDTELRLMRWLEKQNS